MSYYPHQQELLDLNPPKYLLAWGTGVGKTLTSIGLALRNCETCLVICPKALKENWIRETTGISTRFLVLTKEEFKKEWLTLPPYDGVITDEAHYFAGFRNTRDQSQLHRALYGYLKKFEIEYVWLLTATPYLSTPMNIYALGRLLGKKWEYRKFKDHFFYDVTMGRRTVPMVRPGIEEDLKKIILELGDTVKLDEITDVPDQLFETEYLSLSDKQRKGIENIMESNFIVRFTQQHQIENGALKTDGYRGDKLFPNDKVARILDLATEHPKLAVFCRYSLQIEGLVQALRRQKNLKPIFVITGDTPHRDKVIQRAEAADEAIILINASCSEGYELPSFGVIVFASLSFSLKDYIQCQGRFLRINRLKKNVFIHLVSGEIDTAVYECIMKKQDFHLEIYAKQNK